MHIRLSETECYGHYQQGPRTTFLSDQQKRNFQQQTIVRLPPSLVVQQQLGWLARILEDRSDFVPSKRNPKDHTLSWGNTQ